MRDKLRALIKQYINLAKASHEEFENIESGFQKGVQGGFMNCYMQVAKELEQLLEGEE
ncbi:hypothetical protein [Tissierella sp.]|uniref:hypothetical protein n=1 Tax=Tissierella sp. TaxID=41274 RepID=UPI00306A5634